LYARFGFPSASKIRLLDRHFLKTRPYRTSKISAKASADAGAAIAEKVSDGCALNPSRRANRFSEFKFFERSSFVGLNLGMHHDGLALVCCTLCEMPFPCSHHQADQICPGDKTHRRKMHDAEPMVMTL
jgi:hypothetical protein